MAFGSNFISIPGLVATGDLSSSQYKVVIAASTAGAVKVGATAASDPILGVLQNEPESGEAALVAAVGICKALAEISVTYGSMLTVSSTGRVKTTTTDGDHVVGTALEASAAAGDVISVLLGIGTIYE